MIHEDYISIILSINSITGRFISGISAHCPRHSSNMDAKPNLKAEPAYKKLEALYNSTGKQLNMNDLFAADGQRFDKFRWVTPEHGHWTGCSWVMFRNQRQFADVGCYGIQKMRTFICSLFFLREIHAGIGKFVRVGQGVDSLTNERLLVAD